MPLIIFPSPQQLYHKFLQLSQLEPALSRVWCWSLMQMMQFRFPFPVFLCQIPWLQVCVLALDQDLQQNCPPHWSQIRIFFANQISKTTSYFLHQMSLMMKNFFYLMNLTHIEISILQMQSKAVNETEWATKGKKLDCISLEISSNLMSI